MALWKHSFSALFDLFAQQTSNWNLNLYELHFASPSQLECGIKKHNNLLTIDGFIIFIHCILFKIVGRNQPDEQGVKMVCSVGKWGQWKNRMCEMNGN